MSFSSFLILGLLSQSLINAISVFVVPGAFGLVLPVINWKDLRGRKLFMLFLITLSSVSLFYISFFASMKLGESSVLIAGIISGLAGVVQFVLTKMFIPTIRVDALQIIGILILGLLAIPSATWVSDILDGRSATDLFFAIWIIQVGLGMSLSQRVRTTEPEPG